MALLLLCGQSAAQRLRQHRLQQPPALLIGLVELLLQLVAEGHQVGPNSGNTNNHIRFCHHWVADLGWEQVER